MSLLTYTYESSNGEEGKYYCRLNSTFAKLWIVVFGTPPRISQIAETDKPKESPETFKTTPQNNELR